MPFFKSDDIQNWTEGKWFNLNPKKKPEIHGFSIDSRDIGKDFAFVAIKGARDGHDFAADAAANGKIGQRPLIAVHAHNSNLLAAHTPCGQLGSERADILTHLGICFHIHRLAVAAEKRGIVGEELAARLNHVAYRRNISNIIYLTHY